MVSSRDKLKERGLVQIAVWLSQDSAALLKRLASERGQSATKVVEQAIAALAGQPTEPTEPTEPATGDPDVQALVSELAAALERTNERLAALEAPRAPEPALNPKPAKIALHVASTGMSEPGVVRVFAELPDGERAALVAVMQDWHEQGKSLREIGAGLLREHGVGTASGKPLWGGQVKKILDEQSD